MISTWWILHTPYYYNTTCKYYLYGAAVCINIYMMYICRIQYTSLCCWYEGYRGCPHESLKYVRHTAVGRHQMPHRQTLAAVASEIRYSSTATDVNRALHTSLDNCNRMQHAVAVGQQHAYAENINIKITNLRSIARQIYCCCMYSLYKTQNALQITRSPEIR